MRLAISGTHCSGKSTLVEAFLAAHPNYKHEPEAYEQLQESYGESFLAEPSAEEFLRQLEYHIERLQTYRDSPDVIFERCAVDYLAYQQALIELKRGGAVIDVFERSIELTRSVIELVDIVAYLPVIKTDLYVPDDEDPELRTAMDECLERLLVDDELELFNAVRPAVHEVYGTTQQRLQMLESIVVPFQETSR